MREAVAGELRWAAAVAGALRWEGAVDVAAGEGAVDVAAGAAADADDGKRT